MAARELTAAGVTDPALRASYDRCRALLARHGRTYHLATALLPPATRPYVHALYGFARWSDEIVDGPDSEGRAARLAAWTELVLGDLDRGHSSHPVAAAVVDTAQRWAIPRRHFEVFLAAMAADLTVRAYRTYDELRAYMDGSAAAIGLALLPVLGASSSAASAPARDLGYAFQLANFVRDVGEDLDRGRVYLPEEDLERFGSSRAEVERRVVTPALHAALAFQVARVHELREAAAPGIALLHPAVQPGIRAALVLYCAIADAVADLDYQVFDARARVRLRRRVSVAAQAWVAAGRARRRHGPVPLPRQGVSPSLQAR